LKLEVGDRAPEESWLKESHDLPSFQPPWTSQST
jgi:hypothetical protein